MAPIITLLLLGDITGTVTKVHDGDTIHVQTAEEIVKVRLIDLDAPEIDQPGGIESRDFVAGLILGKTVTVRGSEVDQYGRTLGTVFVDGTNVNRSIIEQGHGWWFYHYNSDVELGELEAAAKAKRLGLWKDDTPIYPRNWRNGARITTPPPEVYIMAMMPNPVGDDTDNETITLANRTGVDVALDGWKLEDDDGGSMTLTGTVPASGTMTVRLTSSLQLGNGGDKVTLGSPSGIVHEVSYGSATSGKFIMGAR